jgi:histone H3/H4
MDELRKQGFLTCDDVNQMRKHFVQAQNKRESITTADIRQMRKRTKENEKRETITAEDIRNMRKEN